MKLRTLIHAAADVLMPRTCVVCGKPLDGEERYLCRECLMKLPRTHYEDIKFNVMEQHFAGKVPIERAAAYFFYEKESQYSQILQDIKYRNVPVMGKWLAERAAREMEASGLWVGIDYLVPVPLHFKKLAQRGYNQSDYIAQGISEHTGIAIYDVLEAKAHATQTRKTAYERMLNAQGNYVAVAEAARTLKDKHVMLIDDVTTTGATLLACAESLQHVEGIRISIFTLAAARQA